MGEEEGVVEEEGVKESEEFSKECIEDEEKEGEENESELDNSYLSNIYQGDGADSISEVSTNEGDEANEEGFDIESLAEDGVDANSDIDTDPDDEQNDYEQYIPVHISDIRRQRNMEPRQTVVLRPVNILNKREEASITLPTIAVTNFRSLQPKVENVKIDIIERDIDLLLGTETWQKDSNRILKSNIEKMFEEDGLNFISCPRPSTKRGGGCAVIVNEKKFTVEKLPIFGAI